MINSISEFDSDDNPTFMIYLLDSLNEDLIPSFLNKLEFSSFLKNINKDNIDDIDK